MRADIETSKIDFSLVEAVETAADSGAPNRKSAKSKAGGRQK